MANEKKENARSSKIIQRYLVSVIAALLTALLIFTVAALINIKQELEQLQSNILLIQDSTQHNLSTLEDLKAQKQLLSEVIGTFRNIPKSSTEEIIKKANNYELIKVIYHIRQKLKTSHNILSNLEKLKNYQDPTLADKISNFKNKEFNLLKSNTELSKWVEKIEAISKPQVEEQNYYSRLKSYLSKLVTIKPSEDYKQERVELDRLIQAKKAIEVGNIASAYNILKSQDGKNKELAELQNLLHIRIKLEKLLNEFTLSILEND